MECEHKVCKSSIDSIVVSSRYLMSTVMIHTIDKFTQILQTMGFSDTDVGELVLNLSNEVNVDIMVATQ